MAEGALSTYKNRVINTGVSRSRGCDDEFGICIVFSCQKRGEMRFCNRVDMISVNTRTLGELLLECVGSGL